MDNNSIVMPEFKISNTGRVYCQEHSNYNDDESKHFPEIDFFRIFRGEGKLRCESCLHYLNDNCYFPRTVIDQLRKEMGIHQRRYKCDICKSKISFLSNVLYKLLSEQNSSYKISLICCACYSVLKERESQEMLNKANCVMVVPIIIGLVVFIVNALLSIEMFLRNLVPVLLFIIPATLCALYPPLKLRQRTRKREKWLKSTNF